MQIPAARILQPPNREDVYPHLPRGQPSGRRSHSPPDGVADSPSGGPSKLERSLGQPFGRTHKTRTVTWTALREALSKQPLGHKDRNYDLSTGLHTYGVIYPAGLRRPELVPAGTQTAFRLYETISLGGREECQIMHGFVYESKSVSYGSPHTSYL